MTTDAVIDAVLRNEGGFVDRADDHGGATNRGITSRTLGEYRGLGRPATVAEVKALGEKEARAIYLQRYVQPFALVPMDELKAQLVDIGVTDGPVSAVRMLQEVLGVPIDGIIGQRTLAALGATPWRLVSNGLVACRVVKYARLAERDETQRVFLRGWLNRAADFYVS
jgi:lysozyme family protein